MSDLHDESCVVFGKMAGQLESAMDDLRKLAPDKRVEQLLVTGGGQMHGLLRFPRFGR